MGNFRTKLRHGWLPRLSLTDRTSALPRNEQAVLYSATLTTANPSRVGTKVGRGFGNRVADSLEYLLQLPVLLPRKRRANCGASLFER